MEQSTKSTFTDNIFGNLNDESSTNSDDSEKFVRIISSEKDEAWERFSKKTYSKSIKIGNILIDKPEKILCLAQIDENEGDGVELYCLIQF